MTTLASNQPTPDVEPETAPSPPMAWSRTKLSRVDRLRARSTSLLLPHGDAPVTDPEPNRVDPDLASYTRRSLKTDTSVSMGRQLLSQQRKIAGLGGRYDPTIDAFYDDDISAKGGHLRPGIEELLRLVKAGRYDGVVVWEVSRWTRSGREGRIAGDILRAAGCDLYSVEEPQLTLFGPMAFFYEWCVNKAAKEVETTSARVRDWHAYMARVGAQRSGAPFGMRKVLVPSPFPDRTAPISLLEPDDKPRDELGGQSPAQVVRAGCDALLAGDTIRTIARRWSAAGYPAPRGGPWNGTTTRKVLGNPRLAGYTTVGSTIVLDEAGEPRALFTPVVDPDVWHRVQAEFAARATGPRSNTESLLRGLAKCATCGGPMARSGAGRDRPDSSSAYNCVHRSEAVSQCKYPNSITAIKVEAIVVAAVLDLLADPARLARTLGQGQAGTDQAAALKTRAAALRRRLENLDSAKADGDFDDDDGRRRFRTLKDRATAELEEVATSERRLVARRPVSAVELLGLDAGATRAQVEAAWDLLTKASGTTAAQTTVLLQLIERVEIRRCLRGAGYRFDPTRVHIVWRS